MSVRVIGYRDGKRIVVDDGPGRGRVAGYGQGNTHDLTLIGGSFVQGDPRRGREEPPAERGVAEGEPMKRCRCCRQSWPIEFYTPVGRWRRSTCMACRAGCKRFRERYYARHREEAIARTTAYRAQLREAIQHVRSARMDRAEYSGPIAHNAQRPSVRLYSEREGVGYSGVQTE